MEAADIIAINKADGGQQERSERTRAELKRAVAMLPTRLSGRRAEVVLCSALQESGIDEAPRADRGVRGTGPAERGAGGTPVPTAHALAAGGHRRGLEGGFTTTLRSRRNWSDWAWPPVKAR